MESKAGEGAAFTVYLPASDAGRMTGEYRSVAVAGLKTGGRLLVMDDDIYIRESLGAALLILGYNVSFADNGEDTIKLYVSAMKKGAGYDAVILDLTIPGGMGGKETIEELRRLDPDVRAIASSGYSTGSVMADYRKYGFRAVIPKPYQIEEMNMLLLRVIKSKGV